MLTAPYEKNSALAVAYIVGNSITTSIPFSNAVFVLLNLSTIAIFPACVKLFQLNIYDLYALD